MEKGLLTNEITFFLSLSFWIMTRTAKDFYQFSFQNLAESFLPPPSQFFSFSLIYRTLQKSSQKSNNRAAQNEYSNTHILKK